MVLRLLIDTDTASDDAVALVIALRDAAVAVEAITVVAGNVPLEQAVQNALYTRELCGSTVPVFPGRAAPLARPLETARFVHGEDGMGDVGLPLFGRQPDEGDAVEVLIETIKAAPAEITLVTLGPLSNLAEALMAEPGIARWVKDCIVMGGCGTGTGNVTDRAEYNFWVDPEAAQIVARSGLPLTVVGWDMSVRHAAFGQNDAAELRSLGPLGEFCVDIQSTLDVYARQQSKLVGFDLPDPITMAVAIDPSIARFEKRNFDVIAGDSEDRGRDVWSVSSQRSTRLTTWVDRAAFLSVLHRAVAP